MRNLLVGLVVPLGLMFAAPLQAQPYTISPVAQPSSMSCWAAATTMIVNWRDQDTKSIRETVALAGNRFVSIYNDSFNDVGISPSDEIAFYKALNLKAIEGLNPSIDGWEELLKKHGPLSITVDSNPGKGWIHALVVTGINKGDSPSTTIITYVDPADGKSHAKKFTHFIELYEGSSSWPLQIIYSRK